MSRLTALALLWAATACEKTTDVYQITVALEANTCGANALPLADGLSYRVQLKTAPPKATWKVLPKGPPITGRYEEEDGHFEFQVMQRLSLDNIDAGVVGCTVLRSETLEGTLALDDADGGVRNDAGDTPLTGEHRIDFTADGEGTCRGAMGPLGPFDRLPCQARYAITGEPKEAR